VIWRSLLRLYPHLGHQLRVAHMKVGPEEFLRKTVIRSLINTLLLGTLLAMLVDKQNLSWSLFFGGTLFIAWFSFWFGMKKPSIQSHRRATDIDREVLFAGRFLLIKLHSGKPLINALMEAAESYGVANKYFAEIVQDIELGTTLEDAIQNAMDYTPSKGFRKILFQIHNALQLGVDVTQSLEAVLEDIAAEQVLLIEKYGKKLPSATLFYMIIAVVFPSLGMTILIVLLSFTDVVITMTTYWLVILFLLILNYVFITIFRGIRPKVNI
jgi:pilus assembly protein TadC